MDYKKGSLWRKWDLHIHTPSSYDYDNKSISNNYLIQELKSKGIAAVAITDHHLIDVERIKELKELGGNNLTIFPGIELRSELGGKESVHFIGIFPENCDIDYVWFRLQADLKIGPHHMKGKTDDSVYVDLKDSAKVIHDLDGIVTVHAGKKSNGIEEISNAEVFKRTLKTDLIDSIDILEIGKISDINDYRLKVFPKIGKELPLIICSDNHNMKDYKIKENCWIKADTTFLGLLHAIREPKDRIFTGSIPEKLEWIANNKTKYIKSIKIQKIENAKIGEIWFDNEIQVNPELVAIIGNKGNGKSALVDAIGLIGNTKQHKSFSFLCDGRFRNPKNNKAKHFKVKLEWESGICTEKCLDEDIDETNPELVKYIPQNFLETICNDVGTIKETDFDKELKKVIFSHVQSSDRLGKETLDQITDHKNEEAYNQINIFKQELHDINSEIKLLENQSRNEYEKELTSQVLLKKQELQSQENSKPSEVQKPENDPQKQREIIELNEKIESAQKKALNYNKKIDKLNKALSNLNLKISNGNKLISKIKTFQHQFESMKIDSSSVLISIGLNFDDVVTLEINEEPINNKIEKYFGMKRIVEYLLSQDHPDSLIFLKEEIENSIEELTIKLDEPNKKYQDYVASLEEWNIKRKSIEGDKSTFGSLIYYEEKLKNLQDIPQRLNELKDLRLTKTFEIYYKTVDLVKSYRELYSPVQKFIESYSKNEYKIQLNFEVNIVNIGFKDKFFDIVSHGAAGTFCGVEEGETRLKNIINSYDFNDEEGLYEFLNEIMNSLIFDKRNNDAPVDINKLLRKDKDILELYDFIFSLNYLIPKYELRMGNKELYQLSPGEKGILLLMFYLLVDKSDIPLIIDQPEENLDNQTIFELLVDYIKEAKKIRQVFIVTHNPNLAVVCDAEQIIYANLEKDQNFKMNYISGAIENPSINKLVMDVLEGTRPAFENRDSKYLKG
jgi:ABC-type lipoprotein export system ATPase subunit